MDTRHILHNFVVIRASGAGCTYSTHLNLGPRDPRPKRLLCRPSKLFPIDLSRYSGSHFIRMTAIASDLRVAYRPCRLPQPLSQKIWPPPEDKTNWRLANFSPRLGRHISQQQALHSPSTKFCIRVSGLRHASPFLQKPCPFAAGPPSTALQNP